MSKLDHFTSAFKSAAKDVYTHTRVDVEKVLVVTDLDAEQTERFAKDVKEFLGVINDRAVAAWAHHFAQPNEDVAALLTHIEHERPDLICCYRNLHGRARKYPFSLGAHVDVLTQATTTPVLLLPFPTDEGRLSSQCQHTDSVMVLTDHLTGCDTLIDWGVRVTSDGGKLVLAHLEDDTIFERYLDVIGKIPEIDTDVARKRIFDQLLKEPADYIGSVVSALEGKVAGLRVERDVRMGHRVDDCKKLLAEHGTQLLVMNTKDDEQLAMHGLAYPLAVELRDVPLLML